MYCGALGQEELVYETFPIPLIRIIPSLITILSLVLLILSIIFFLKAWKLEKTTSSLHKY